MGDAGSLALGFVLVVAGLSLMNTAQDSTNSALTLSVVIGVLLLPVLDSLRVYRNRIKRGDSPFQADRTHFHHLVLAMGMKHKVASAVIALVVVFILLLAVLVGSLWSVTIAILALLLLFGAIARVLILYQEVRTWGDKLKALERK
jgi:UDP-GlcNAc:undecaprenyl-phosphate GlcNAc-1-phosphate transferase